MKRRDFLYATLSAAALLCSPSLLAAPSNFDDIRASGRLRVAVYRDFPPFSFEKNGVLQGIDVDLAKRIGQKIGLEIEFMQLTATEDVDGDLRNAIWKGHYLGGGTADLMLHVPNDQDFATRNHNAVLFAPYWQEQLSWAAPNGAPRSSWDIHAEERIGVENDSLADLYLSALQGGRLRDHIQHFPNTLSAVQALKNEQVDGVFAPQAELSWALHALGLDIQPQVIKTPGLIKARWNLGMATKESLRDLTWVIGDIVEQLRQAGELSTIFERYHSRYLPAVTE